MTWLVDNRDDDRNMPSLSPVHISNSVEATFAFVERIVSTCSIRQCCFDIVAGADGASAGVGLRIGRSTVVFVAIPTV